MTEHRTSGPVDYLLLEFPEQDDPTGEAASELRALVESGVIRLYDILAIHKQADGTHRLIDLGQFSTSEDDGFAYFAGAQSGLLNGDDVTAVAEVLDSRTYGLVLVYENAWAEGFVTAAMKAGGAMIASQRIPAANLVTALDEQEK